MAKNRITGKIKLTNKEREELMAIINKGIHSSQRFRNAYILLNCDGWEYTERITNKEMAKVLKIGTRTIDRVKKRFVEEGFNAAIERKETERKYERKADGNVEARLIELICGKPPDGYARWSLRLLADKMVELNYVKSISHETVRTVLKKRFRTPEGKRADNSARQ